MSNNNNFNNNNNNNKPFLITFSSVSRSGHRPNEPQTPTSRLMLTRREFQAFPKFFSISPHTHRQCLFCLFFFFSYGIDQPLFSILLFQQRNPPYTNTHRMEALSICCFYIYILIMYWTGLHLTCRVVDVSLHSSVDLISISNIRPCIYFFLLLFNWKYFLLFFK